MVSFLCIYMEVRQWDLAIFRSHLCDTNPRPDNYELSALPAELRWPGFYSGGDYKGLQLNPQVFRFTRCLCLGSH